MAMDPERERQALEDLHSLRDTRRWVDLPEWETMSDYARGKCVFVAMFYLWAPSNQSAGPKSKLAYNRWLRRRNRPHV